MVYPLLIDLSDMMITDSVIDDEFNEDDRGQVFSLDVLLSLIIITVIIGVSANAIDLVSFKIANYFSGKSFSNNFRCSRYTH